MVTEAAMLEAIFFGHEAIQPLIELQNKLKESIGVPKRPFAPPENDEALLQKLESEASDRLKEALTIPQKKERYAALRELKA